jgi:hypothetical protein
MAERPSMNDKLVFGKPKPSNVTLQQQEFEA